MATENVPDTQSGDKEGAITALVPIEPTTTDTRMTHAEFLAVRNQMKLVLHGAALKCAVMLLDIRDREGWYYDYASFKEFVNEEFGKSRSRAYYLITYAEVVSAALPPRADLDQWAPRVPTERRVRGLINEYGKGETSRMLRDLLLANKALPSPDGRPGDDLDTVGDLLDQTARPIQRRVSSVEDTSRSGDAVTARDVHARRPDGEFHATDKDDAPRSQREIASGLHDDILTLTALARRVRQATDHANSKKLLRSAFHSNGARAHALDVIRVAMSALSEMESAINLLDEPS